MKLFPSILNHRQRTPTPLAASNTAFHRRSIAAAQSEVAQLRKTVNRYEAAQVNNPNRSYLPAFVRDARFDANSFTRWELVRKVRYFERNVWLVQKLREIFIKYTVGTNGLPVIPASSDPEWNKRALESYNRWCEYPALDSTTPMGQLHKLIAGSYIIDGGIFILKTRGKTRADQQSFPRIQLIESHRVSSPGPAWGGFYGADNQGMVDGVGIDGNGRPISYSIRDGFNDDTWTERPADQVIHVFEPTRPGMYREITPFHSVLNPLHDLDDLEILEMEKAKANSEISYIVKTWNGEMPNTDTMRQQRLLTSGGTVTGEPDAALSKRIEMYRKILGSRTIATRPGEDVQQFASETPSASTQWYWRYKISQICSAVGVPMILVLPESVQGTVTRAVLDDANLFFRSKFALFGHAAKEIYRFYADWARYNDPKLVDAPADWANCHVIPPRAVNVDNGRNSAAMLAELEAGTTNWDDWAASGGTTPEVLIRKKARNVAMIKRIAKEESKDGIEVLPSEISGPMADIVQKLALAEAAKAQTEMAHAQSNE